MNISNTDFNITLHSAELKGGNNHPEYYFFNSDTSCDLIINGSHYPIILQSGLSCYNGDHSLPSEDIDYSEDGGCDEFIIVLNEMGEYEIQNLDAESLKELQEDFSMEFNVEDLLEIYFHVCDLSIKAQSDLECEIEENGQYLIEE